MKFITVLVLTLCFKVSFAQIPPLYYNYVTEAMELYKKQMYGEAILKFDSAFSVKYVKIQRSDAYNVACCYALLNDLDGAFKYLNVAVNEGQYFKLAHINKDSDFQNLRNDERWQGILAKVEDNKNNPQRRAIKYPNLKKSLDSIGRLDQLKRKDFHTIRKEFGLNSKEFITLKQEIKKIDSSNIIAVKSIIDKHGWLSVEEVGFKANNALFLVFQHANLKTREEYLPTMRLAAKDFKMAVSDLAFIEDRVLMSKDMKQLYGTQVELDTITNTYHSYPIENKESVDSLRRDIGLEPILEYLDFWGIKEY